MSNTEQAPHTPETPGQETGHGAEHTPETNVTFEKPRVGLIRGVIHAIIWLIYGFGHLLHGALRVIWWAIKRMLGVHRNAEGEDEVVVFSYPSLVLAWPLIVLGYFFWITQSAPWFSPEATGWIWLTTLGVIFIALGTDIGIAYLLVIGLVLALVTVCIKYANNLLGWTIFIQIGEAFSRLAPQFSPDLGLAASIFLTILYVIMIINAKVNDRLEMDNNVFSWVKILRKTNSFPRAGRSVNWEFPDIFAMILGLGAGNLEIVYQGHYYYVTNVPFLLFRLHWIKKILEAVQTTVDHATAEILAAEHDHTPDEHPVG